MLTDSNRGKTHKLNKSLKSRAMKIAIILKDVATFETVFASLSNKEVNETINRATLLLSAMNSNTRKESQFYLNQLA